MNAEELIEAEAAYLHLRYASPLDLPLPYKDRNEHYKDGWRQEALAHFKALNGWGVSQTQWIVDNEYAHVGHWLVVPLPEAKE